ncbi:MAG: excalibur calcium-binding domain-containing protein [Proteobacteria bacterium]|nr:excalibur calcium-binding domain-containing protein [Pseudomonadota bacterium]
MKKLLFLAIAIAIGWSIYGKYIEPKYADMAAEYEPTETESEQHYSHNESFKCDGRQYCSEMTSRAEAEFFIRNCPDTKMDGDNDGIPCENDSRF